MTSSRINPHLLLGIKVAAVLGIAVTGLGILYSASDRQTAPSVQHSTTETALAGQYAFQVGTPGPGEQAPAIRLPATDGTVFNLADLRGKTVLLYFQEGIMCPACWDQLRDIEQNAEQFKALGIDQVVSISTDSQSLLAQKNAIEQYASPLLSDPDLRVSHTYTTNLYGMMGDSMNGHSFILVGPDGKIYWRADYGGAPNYTMYIPIPNLLADLRQGIQSYIPQ